MTFPKATIKTVYNHGSANREGLAVREIVPKLSGR
jgi:hypothetical protein